MQWDDGMATGGRWQMLFEIETDLKCCNRPITRLTLSPLALHYFPRLSGSFSHRTFFISAFFNLCEMSANVKITNERCTVAANLVISRESQWIFKIKKAEVL